MFSKSYFISFFLQVDEAGTEAAAATAPVGECLFGAAPRPPVPFVADQPFLWALCSPDGDGGEAGAGGGMPLFMGVFGGEGGEKSHGGGTAPIASSSSAYVIG
jgi:hypothetical protein